MNKIENPEPLISIIVPAYNVEKYIGKCLESIICQTYKKIEVLVINDGSPDQSGRIADDFSRRDSRLRVIHTDNRGVSTARNLGIDESKGNFIAFVDGDDWLSPDFVEYMIRITRVTGSNFAMSKKCFKSPKEEQTAEDKIEKYSADQAAAALLYPYIEIGCWNKLFSREFLINNNIRFPIKFFMGEGLNFIVKAAELSNCVGVGSRKVYYYRKDNMESATTKVSVEKFINALAAIENIRKNSTLNTLIFRVALDFHQYLTTFYALKAILLTGTEKKFPVEYKQWRQAVKGNALRMMKAEVSILLKTRILFYSICPTYALRSRIFLGKIKRSVIMKSTA